MSSPLGPGGRPFRGLRIVAMVLAVADFGANALVLLADRAPGIFSRVSARIDAGVTRAAGAAGVEGPGRTVRVPQSDFDVHVVLWAVAALLVGLAMWSWLSLLVASAAVFATSVVIELAQQSLTVFRTVQASDVLGNALGVLLGTAAAAAFAATWWAFSTRRSAPRP